MVAKLGEVAPDTAMLFTNHWYVGLTPPLLTVDVKVTEVPEHKLLPGALLTIFTAGWPFMAKAAEAPAPPLALKVGETEPIEIL